MELMFSRFDLDRLVMGDWQLICGRWEQADKAGRLLKIEDDGLYVNAQDRWEHPGDDGLVLPIPFTLAQFKEFCERHPTFEWEAVESQFTNDDESLDEDALKELASLSEAAAALVRGVLVGPGDDAIKALEARRKIEKCRAEIADLESLKPTTITERVLARQELDALKATLATLLNPEAEPEPQQIIEAAPLMNCASLAGDQDDTPTEEQTARQDAPECNGPGASVAQATSMPVIELFPQVAEKSRVPKLVEAERPSNSPIFSMPRAALIAAHEHEWPTIRGDISEAHSNGLDAAKAGPRGWWEARALDWARAKGRLKPEDLLAQAVRSMNGVPGRRHKLED